MKKIIVIGGGFAGLNFVRSLRRKDVEVLVIDKLNYHQFQPLFYQVASARLEASSISFPLRKHFQRYKNVSYRLADVQGVDISKQLVQTDIGDFHYDELVIAAGCRTNFFGNEEIERNAMPMKSIPEALALRNQVLSNFEHVVSLPPEQLEPYMNIVVVGGGPTGVELSGALIELKKNILPRDFPDIDFSPLNIHLVEAGKNLLAPMSAMSHKMSREYLEKMGVNVLTETLVKSYDGKKVTFADGREIFTNQLIWAAGVVGNQINGLPEEAKARGNRIVVDRYHRVVGVNNIYALGDISYMVTPKYPNGHPQVANVAINQGKNLGKNLRKGSEDKWTEFEYHNKGSMATIGKCKAVVDLPGFSFHGRIAWFFWMFLHLMLILSVKNKLITFINWMYSYFTNDSSLRLIIEPTEKHSVPKPRVKKDIQASRH